LLHPEHNGAAVDAECVGDLGFVETALEVQVFCLLLLFVFHEKRINPKPLKGLSPQVVWAVNNGFRLQGTIAGKGFPKKAIHIF
jgi:hypothetical protein